MIGGCLVSTSYSFKADLYNKIRTQKPSGQLDYKWQFWKTIDCLIVPFLTTSFRLQAITETFGEEYNEYGYLRLLAPERLGSNLQVTNLRNANGEVIYVETELKGQPATWYNTNGSTPIQDPFGRILQWDTLLVRAQTQGEISV